MTYSVADATKEMLEKYGYVEVPAAGTKERRQFAIDVLKLCEAGKGSPAPKQTKQSRVDDFQ